MRDVFVMISGGLGTPQTGEIVEALAPLKSQGVRLWTPEQERDQYAADFTDAVLMRPSSAYVAIMHSFAVQAEFEMMEYLAAQGVTFSYIAAIGGVAYHPVWGDLDFPAGDAAPIAYDVLKSETPMFVREATINGATQETIPGTNHNSICQNTKVIERLQRRLRQVLAMAAIAIDISNLGSVPPVMGVELAPGVPSIPPMQAGDTK